MFVRKKKNRSGSVSVAVVDKSRGRFREIVDKVIDIAKTIISIDIKTDGVAGTARRTLFLTDEQKIIQPLFDLEKLVRHFG